MIHRGFSSWHGLCTRYIGIKYYTSFGRRSLTRIVVMKSGKFENGLALVGILIVLFAVTTAANTALADEFKPLEGSLKTEVSASR